MKTTSEHPSIAAARRRLEPEVKWNYVPCLEPGEYSAYCRSAKIYRDGNFQRWVCAVQFDVVSDDRQHIRDRVTWFLNLGKNDKPRATRRSNYWIAWIEANGGRPPRRMDRMSSKIFTHRYARILVDNTAKNFKQAPVSGESGYSVVRSVVRWETGGRER
jgi:hypothetical protein